MGHDSSDPSSKTHSDTRFGHPTDASDDPLTLTPTALRDGTYIKGTVRKRQTALCVNLMAQ
ncbi:hypothetical protein [Halorarius halobius]|uniref:hypothetical protein n=1 Tax=Halorarius halobius TaxID=2962671 RepID=UPI0020CDE3A9|nr:hypothetical protein [Halorarius halobius]